MNDIFGIPLNGIMIFLLTVLILCLLSVAWVAWRRPVIFKLGTRNIPRRKAQTTLIVAGLMLSTLIMAAALGTGDTVNYSITSTVYDQLGHVDEIVISSHDVDASLDQASLEPMDPAALPIVEHAVAGDPNVDGVMPLLDAHVPFVNDAQQLAEPDVVLTGIDPTRLDAFGGLTATNGRAIDFGALGSDEIVISETLADDLEARVGDQITVYLNDTPRQLRVAAVATDGILSTSMPLASMQALTNQPGAFTSIAISNTGGIRDGLERSDVVVSSLHQTLAGQGLGVDPVKQDLIDDANTTGETFTTVFVLLGLFSVMSGVLLIVLIFTMLASERRAEMGMERAIGTQRRQLIQQFVAEGSGYALAAGLVGAAFGVLAAYGIAIGMNFIFGEFVSIEAHVTPRSLVVAYCLGMVITFLTVVVSSWMISRLNIVAAIRDFPEVVPQRRRRSTLVWGIVLTTFGALIALAGSGGETALFTMGLSLLPFGIALILCFVGVSGRLVFTLVGLWLLVFWLLPESTFNDLFGNFDYGIEMFFLSGIFMVVGATIVILQNTDLLLAGVSKVGGLFRSKLPAVRTAVAYPSAARGRTGLTIAMFSLIVFSIVIMATMNQNYIASVLGDEANAGWDVRADTFDASPPDDLQTTLQAEGVDTSGFESVGVVTNPSQYLSRVRLVGADDWKSFPVLGMDRPFIESSKLTFGQRAIGYATDADIVQALATEPDLAIIDATAVPVSGNIGEDEELLKLEGLTSSDDTFQPVTVELADPRDGSTHTVTIIGVIDSTIGSLSGLYANQATIDAFYPPVTRTSYYVALSDSGRSDAVAKEIESALLHDGMQGVSIRDELKDQQKQEGGFLYIIEGFMALGLLVGVAATGVIAFRSVVERRQQIGVLRALGWRRELISLSFMIETLYVVVLGVATGTILGLVLSRNLVNDPDQGYASDINFVIPWTIILSVIAVTIAVALLMTWIPARQAGRIAPAEALRYE